MKLDVVFVCQQGELEVMACLLAASLRKNCGNQVFLHLIEPIPKEEYGVVSPVVRKFLDGLDVQWYPFGNPISDEYKVFNKLNAFNIQPQGDKILFLDNDTVVRHPLHVLSAYRNRQFAARCGYKQAFSADEEEWKLVYQLFDLPVPKMRWPAADRFQWGPPYFNAAVILVDPAVDFSKHWIDTCRRIHQDENLWSAVKNKNRNTVQIGLPVTVYRRNLSYALLDSRFNFGLSRTRVKVKKPLAWSDDEGYIFHYTNPARMLKAPFVLYEVNELVKGFKLEEVFSLLPAWRKLLMYLEELDHDSTLHISKPRSSLFVPNITNRPPIQSAHRSSPRSERPDSRSRFSSVSGGASRDESATASAKPAAIKPRSRAVDHVPESGNVFVTEIPCSGARLFASLLAELPRVTVLNEPDLEADSKNALGKLSRVEEILNAHPEATVFIVLRNPFDTIAAWMQRLDLREAKIIEEDELTSSLSEEQRQHFSELRGVRDLAMKRAGLWDYFAGLANMHAERVHIFRYEDIVANPRAVLKYAYQKLFSGVDFDVPDLALRDQAQEVYGTLSEWDKECIRAICSNNAGVFGYNLYES